ncbi:unnamed protein product, partial [marine sediment metagenome]
DEFTDRVEYRNLFMQEDLVNFLDWTSKVPLLQGILPNKEYHYNFDAHKFARKVYAITDYAKEGKQFVFLGADTRCIKPVTQEFLDGLFDGYVGVFLLRRHLDTHVESDFAGYDPRDDGMKKMLHIYREAYNNGSFLELDGWHDCIMLDRLLDVLKLTDRVNNLSDGVKGEGRLGLHVWPNTVLAEYMVHLKGGMKKGKEVA